MIPLNDLQRHSSSVADEVSSAISGVVGSGWYILGREVTAFEREFADYCGAAECVGLANGTDALEIAMRALGIGPGSRVATVANAGMYSATALAILGAEPRYVDIEPRFFLADAAGLEARLDGVSAIVATHLYGRLADMDAIVAIARRKAIPVIEDCAQAHGARRAGRRGGTFGRIGCFSFYPTKNLGAIGDGGAIVTDDHELAARVRQLRQYGWSHKYVVTLAGGRNSRLDELQAAVLRRKLPLLDSWNERRREIARFYLRHLEHPGIRVEREPDESDVVHLFVVRSAKRDSLAAHCKARGVATDVHYPVPDFLQPASSGAIVGERELPETRRACAEVITLPCYPEMRDDEVRQVAEVVNAWQP